MVKKKTTIFIILSIISLFANIYINGLSSASDNTKGIFLIDHVVDWEVAGFNSSGRPLYNSDGLTVFYMPIALKKEDVHNLELKDIAHTIYNGNNNFTNRLVNISYDLLESTDYYVVIYKMNVIASESGFNIDFVPKIKGEEAPFKQFAWWNSSFLHRIDLWVEHEQVTATLNSFPVLVKLTNSTVINMCKNDGSDIVFVSSDNLTKYNHEIDTFNSTTGLFWVNITQISNSADTHFNFYYNCSTASNQSNPAGVWDSDYVTVCHLNSGLAEDSTSNNNDGTVNGADKVNTIIGQGLYLDGGSDYVNYGTSSVFTPNKGTYEFFVRAPAQPATADNDIFDKGMNSDNKGVALYFETSSNVIRSRWRGVTDISIDKPRVGTSWTNYWEYPVLTWANTGVTTGKYFYWNGTIVGSNADTNNPPDSGKDLLFGQGVSRTYPFCGTFDEIRISSRLRSSDYIATTYNTIMNQSTFIIWGNEYTYEEAENHRANVTIAYLLNNTGCNNSLGNFSFNITDEDGDSFTYTIQIDNGLNESGTGDNGTFDLVLIYCLIPKTYTIWVNVTDDGTSTVNSFWYQIKVTDVLDGGSMELTIGSTLIVMLVLAFIAWMIHKMSQKYVGIHTPLGIVFLLVIMLNYTLIDGWFESSFLVASVIGIMVLIYGTYKDFKGLTDNKE